MQRISLEATAREQLELAATHGGRAAHTVVGGHERVLRQTVIALLQDSELGEHAVNLSWKLALVLQGRGGDHLLDTYDAERLPVIRRLITSTTASTKPLLWRNPLAVAARDTFLRLILPIPALQTALFDSFTGFTVRYQSGAFVPSGRHLRRRRGPRPGEIAPEAGNGGRRWYPLWGNDTRHQLLVFGEPGAARDAALGWADRHREVVRPLVVTAQAPAGCQDVVEDPTGALHRRYGARAAGGLYLVRPDGYVAARSALDDLAPLTAYLDVIRVGSQPLSEIAK